MRWVSMKKIVVAVVFVLISFPLQSHPHDPLLDEIRKGTEKIRRGAGMGRVAKQWRCTPNIKNGCGGKKCESLNPSTWVILDISKGLYRRCDKNMCTSDFKFKYRLNGIFSIIEVGLGMFLKAANPNIYFMKSSPERNKGWPYVGVASVHLTVLVSHGFCLPIK